jgi:hypothetical protein
LTGDFEDIHTIHAGTCSRCRWRFFHKTSSKSWTRERTRHIILIVSDERTRYECLSRHFALPEEKHTIKKYKSHTKSGTKWIEQAFGTGTKTAPQADNEDY